jgi:hypothetical protein
VLTIDDFVMLGKTVPEPNSDGRVFVCSAGVSTQLRQLVRIYPLARWGAPKRWDICTVSLERNPKDSRAESWKLHGDRSPGQHDQINNTFAVTGPYSPPAREALLAPFAVESIAEANARKLSLAVIHPDAIDLEFEHNPTSPDSPQLALFDVGAIPTAGAKRFPFIPRLRFRDGGVDRCLMLRDWGVYERMRKQPGFDNWPDSERREHIAGAVHLDSSCSLFVGNFNQHRTSWLVISVLRGLKAEPGLFDDLLLTAGGAA